MRRLHAVNRWLTDASLLLIACALLASCGSDGSTESSQTVRNSSVTRAAAVPDEPTETIADARQAADRDDYAAALNISESLRSIEAKSVRRRIANRLAERALATLDAGERGRAREFIIEGKSYPSTRQARSARASYEAAKAQAAEERRRNAEQRRIAEAMRRPASMKPPAMRMMPRSPMGMMRSPP